MGLRKALAVVAAVIMAAAAVALLTTQSGRPPMGTPAKSGPNAPTGSPAGVGLNAPIYVVGPQQLVRRLVAVGVPQSLIRSVDVSNLSLVPPGSAVVVDWGYLLGHLGGKALVVESLEPLLKGGDLVVIAVPSPDEAPAAFNARVRRTKWPIPSNKPRGFCLRALIRRRTPPYMRSSASTY